MFCQISLQWTCTVCRFVSMFDNITLGSIGKMNRKFLVFKTFVDIGKHKLNNASDIVFGKRFKHDNLIKTIQKLWSKVGTQVIHDHSFCIGLDVAIFIDSFEQILGTDIGGHD